MKMYESDDGNGLATVCEVCNTSLNFVVISIVMQHKNSLSYLVIFYNFGYFFLGA